MARRRLLDGARTLALAALKTQIGPLLARKLPGISPADLQAALEDFRKAAQGNLSARSALARLKPPDRKVWQPFEDFLAKASAEELDAFLGIRENAEVLSRSGLRNLYVVFKPASGSPGATTPVVTTRKPRGDGRPAPDRALADLVHGTMAAHEKEMFADAATTLGLSPHQAMLVVLRLLDTVRPDKATRAHYPSTRGGFLAEMGIVRSPAVRKAEMEIAFDSVKQILEARQGAAPKGSRVERVPDDAALRSAIAAAQDGPTRPMPLDATDSADPIAALKDALASGGVAPVTRGTWIVRTTEVRDDGVRKGRLVTDRTLMLVEWRGTDNVVLHPISIGESKLRTVADQLPSQLVESFRRLAQGVSGADVLPKIDGLKIEVQFPKRVLAIAFHETESGKARFDAAEMRKVPANVKRALKRPDLRVDLLTVDGAQSAQAARRLISVGLQALDRLNSRANSLAATP